jgi:hypothetical protein
VVAIPLLVTLFLAVRRHYRRVERATALGPRPPAPVAPGPVVVWVERRDGLTAEALWYARRIGRDRVRVARGPRAEERTLPSDGEATAVALRGDARPLDALVEYVERLPRGPDAPVTAVVPELFRRRSLGEVLLGHARLHRKLRVLREHDVVTADVTGLANEPAPPLGANPLVGIVLAARVDRPTVRAVSYARSLRLDAVRGLAVALDEADATALHASWKRHVLGVGLEVVQMPLRDIGPPVLDYVRRVTAVPGAIAVVIVPNLLVAGPTRLLHNRHELYLRRLLLLEPRVILAGVPYRLD